MDMKVLQANLDIDNERKEARRKRLNINPPRKLKEAR
jgi:hypothetical protein